MRRLEARTVAFLVLRPGQPSRTRSAVSVSSMRPRFTNISPVIRRHRLRYRAVAGLRQPGWPLPSSTPASATRPNLVDHPRYGSEGQQHPGQRRQPVRSLAGTTACGIVASDSAKVSARIVMNIGDPVGGQILKRDKRLQRSETRPTCLSCHSCSVPEQNA